MTSTEEVVSSYINEKFDGAYISGYWAGHDKMQTRADLRGGTQLVSFNHVIDHFVTFCSSSYTTICNTNPDPKPNRKPNPNLNPNHNPTLITDTIQYNKMS